MGDLRRTDVAGAKGVGMVTVRFTGVFDDNGEHTALLHEADHVVSDLRKVPEVLGLT